jgi:hypothetical protein
MRTDVGTEIFVSSKYAESFRNEPLLKVFPFTAKVGEFQLLAIEEVLCFYTSYILDASWPSSWL